MIACVLMCGGKGTRLKTNNNLHIEKPLLNLRNKPLIEYVIEAVRKSGLDIKIFAAISNNTSRTRLFLAEKYLENITLIETSGIEYSKDYLEVLKFFKDKESSTIKKENENISTNNNINNNNNNNNNTFSNSSNTNSSTSNSTGTSSNKKYKILFLPIDLPLISSKTINKIINLKQKRTCITIISNSKYSSQYGINPSYKLKINNTDYFYTGISVIDYLMIDWSKKNQWFNEELKIADNIEFIFNINTLDDLKKAEKYLINRSKTE